MQAALNSDKEMVRLLLERGADANAHPPAGCSALCVAVHDPDKVRLLLDKGALVDDLALMTAATVPGARPTLEMLLRAGGKVEANLGGGTVLTAAAQSGDLDSVRFLLDRGASPKAHGGNGLTPLIFAVLCGNADMVRLLIDKGDDVNARQEIFGRTHQVTTPVITAVLQGYKDCLRLLLDRGADVNVQGGRFLRTALLQAATAGDEEMVRLLLARGADVRAKDSDGRSAVAWAEKRDPNSAIVKLLRQARGEQETSPTVPKQPAPHAFRLTGPVNPDAATITSAIERTLPLLQNSGLKFTKGMECVSCHQQSMVALTVSMARTRGLPVDEQIAQEERASVIKEFREKPDVVLGQGDLDPLLVPWTLWSLGAENQEAGWVTDSLVQYLVIHQFKDGSWKKVAYRPPSDASDFTATALAIRGLQFFAPKGRCREIEARIARARAWLLRTSAPETEDKAMRLLGLGWTNAGEKPIQEAAALLLSEQREDGGWSQLPSLAPDAYATGEVLYALHEGGKIPVSHLAYQRGLVFLLRTQLADGSWLVPTRSFPIIEYFNSGFPHGQSQFISTAGTCWAMMALALTIPGKDEYPALACPPSENESVKPAGKVPLASSK